MRALKVTSGPAAGQSLEVEADVVIGREGADLTIPDEEISRRHAVVRPVERGVVVEDLGSTNGTYVNGKQISEPVTLTLGSTLRVGNSDIDVELDLIAPTKVREIVPAGEPTVARDVPPPTEEAAVPPPAAAPPPPAPTAPEEKPPPGGPRGPAPPPRYGGPSDSEGSRRPKPPVIAGIALAAVALVVVLVLVLGGGGDDDSTETRDLNAKLTLKQLSAEGKKETMTGEQTGPPAGAGTAEVVLTFGTDPKKITGKTKLSGTVASRFDNGSYSSTFEGTLTPKPDGTGTVAADGKVKSGTGDFEGATGTFKVDGDFNAVKLSSNLTLKGSIEY